MWATRAKRGFVLSCFILLLGSTCTGVVSGRKTAAHRRHPALKCSRRGHQGARVAGAHHRPLTDEQEADQNLQFMLSLYQSAAGPDGRPKQRRKFGSNTVRLLRPSASSVHYLPATDTGSSSATGGSEFGDRKLFFWERGNFFTFSDKLRVLCYEALRRLCNCQERTDTTQALEPPPRCRAQITSLGPESLVTLEPHERWTETDITAHVTGHVLQRKDQGTGGHLTLTAQYWCTEPGLAEEDSSLWWWWTHLRARRREEPHLEVPSLLLYLEEEREVKDWMGELLGAEGKNVMGGTGQWHPSLRRRRRSKDSSDAKDPSLDALKNAPTSSSSFSTSPSASIISEIPNYKRKTSTPKNRCKLHSFRLSFDELGWGHYFIAPPVYNPRFCQGDCPRVLHYGYHSPNHAIIQTVINDLGVGDVPPPSCVPYKYMPMSVLVVHKKKVEYRELEDMVAESCTCR
nr:bone morphogenetic protein 15 [Rachycentron canadum]